MATEEELWKMSLADLVDEGLDKSERAHGVDYAQKARAVLQARLLTQATASASEAAESARKAAWLTAISTLLLVAATIALAVATFRLVD